MDNENTSTKKTPKGFFVILACVIALIVMITVISIVTNGDNLEEASIDDTIGTSATTIGTSATTVNTTTTPITTTTVTTTTTVPVTTTTQVTTTTWDYTPAIKKSNIEACYNANPDCKGWIYLRNSAIDYPIMQSGDNEYYITHDWNGAESHSGSIMLDYNCQIGGANVLLYGHNMANGSMFHQVKSYKDTSWWDNHQYVEVASLDKVYVYQIFSIDVLYGLEDASFTYWLEPYQSLATKDVYDEFVKNVVNKRYTSNGISAPEYPTGILTLQTCNSGADDGMRCVAFGKLKGVFDLT